MLMTSSIGCGNGDIPRLKILEKIFENLRMCVLGWTIRKHPARVLRKGGSAPGAKDREVVAASAAKCRVLYATM